VDRGLSMGTFMTFSIPYSDLGLRCKRWASWTGQNGKLNRRSTGVANRKLAEALAAKWVKDGFMEEHFGKKPEVPFSEAVLRYASDVLPKT